MSDFFEPPSPPKVEVKPAPREDWMGPPTGVVPAVVPIERVIARTDEVGIYLSCFSVYPAGFEFEVFVTAKDECTDLDPLQFDHHYRAQDTGEIPPGKLRLGFQFADGTKVVNTNGHWDGELGSSPKSPVMSGIGGSSGEGQWHHSYWIWPLPPPGPLEFICEWPAAEIPLTRSDLDAAAIIEAASRAQAIFPNG